MLVVTNVDRIERSVRTSGVCGRLEHGRDVLRENGETV